MGRFFWWEAVLELSPEESRPRVSEHLMALVRKELIVPERSGAGREHSFRFRHALIRDAAYAGISKEARSLLHERFALWLEDRSPEYDEIVGYHLEQAFRYREALGPLDDRARALAAHGGWLLAVAGDRAQSRGDLLAAANLFERALALLPEETPERLELLCDLGRALIQIGSLARAEEVLTEAIESAEAIGDRRVRSNGRLPVSANRDQIPARALQRARLSSGVAHLHAARPRARHGGADAGDRGSGPSLRGVRGPPRSRARLVQAGRGSLVEVPVRGDGGGPGARTEPRQEGRRRS